MMKKINKKKLCYIIILITFVIGCFSFFLKGYSHENNQEGFKVYQAVFGMTLKDARFLNASLGTASLVPNFFGYCAFLLYISSPFFYFCSNRKLYKSTGYSFAFISGLFMFFLPRCGRVKTVIVGIGQGLTLPEWNRGIGIYIFVVSAFIMSAAMKIGVKYTKNLRNR